MPQAIYYRMPFVHQAAFVRVEVAQKYMFDLKYHYSADFEQFIKLFLDNHMIKVLDYSIVIFDVEGTSNKNIISVIAEHEKIRLDNKIFFNRILYRFIRYVGILCVRKVKILYVCYIKLMRQFQK